MGLRLNNIGSSNGHSPVLNLSKSGGGGDQGSTGDQSDRSQAHSPAQSIRDDDENLSDDNISDVDEREEKDDGKFSRLRYFDGIECDEFLAKQSIFRLFSIRFK